MSIWQNFREADHSFEKKFFGVIFLFAAGMAFFFLADKALDTVPGIRKLFVDNRSSFIFFSMTLIIIFFGSKDLRSQLIKDAEEDKKLAESNNYEPYVLCLDKKYYSGYYGLICLPVYLVSLLIGYIL